MGIFFVFKVGDYLWDNWFDDGTTLKNSDYWIYNNSSHKNIENLYKIVHKYFFWAKVMEVVRLSYDNRDWTMPDTNC